MKLLNAGRPGEHSMGVIVPSSNRVVERVTEDVLSFFPQIDACYARVSYWGRGNGQPAIGYDEESFLGAAELLSHAEPSVIIWNGTRASAFDFDLDRQLCEEVMRRFGIRADTTSLATLDVFRTFNVRRVALVTGGPLDYIDRIVDNFEKAGVEVVSQLRLGEFGNADYAKLDVTPIFNFCLNDALVAGPDAILVWSTNLPGHGVVAEVEKLTGIPVFDSAAIGVWAGLREVGVDSSPVAVRGRLFAGK